MEFLTLEDFHRARVHIEPHIHRTPVIRSATLDALTGAEIYLKAELFQKAGSYKVRGPLNVLAHMSAEDKAKGLICSSAGNHAQGVARAARIHGVPAVVVMSRAAKPAKIEATRGYGAEVIIHGDVWDDAYAHSLEIAAERGLTYVHPFDDPKLVVGQGGVGLEFVEDVPDLDVMIVPIGGGGLIAGCAQAAKALNPKIRIIGVEASHAPAMYESVKAGHVVKLDSFGPMVDGLVVKRVGDYTFKVVQNFVDDIVLMDEAAIFDTVIWAMERLKVVPEGAAASTITALLSGKVKFNPGDKVGCVLSGGNLDLTPLRGLVLN
jgi:threonine dehydratase